MRTRTSCGVLAALFLFATTATAQGNHALLDRLNLQLASQGADLQIEKVEWITASDEAGQTIFFNNRGNKRLGSHWVPGDPRRGGFTDIAYFVDLFDGATSSGLSAGDTTGAIDRAMTTWDQQNCSTIPITNIGAFNVDLGYVQFLLGFGGVAAPLFDITHAGFLGGAFFDALTPGGSGFILGVTFTFIWLDPATGDPSDVDNNGRQDTAFREIYYNDAFSWAIGGNIDVETVALHEAGHGLSQAHFGKLSRTDSNGKFHFAPQAVMNAGYTQVQQTLLGTDNAGHCSSWGSWPNN